MSNIEFDFFMSQIKHIETIKDNPKTKISMVFYESMQAPCILRVCKNRNLTNVYDALINTKHPNLVTIYDYVFFDDNTYVIEEFIAGKTLRELMMEKGNFSEKETKQIIGAVCDGLEVLHRYRPPVVHNDINISNIMIREDGSVKLIDFDISRLYKEGADRNTQLFGTEGYASPEHYGFGQSEPRSDIYSLGVTMHEMLTGKRLDSEHKTTYNGKIAKVIKKCISVDRKKRYSNVRQLKNDLKKKRSGILVYIVLFIISFVISWNMFYRDSISEKPLAEDRISSESYVLEEESSNQPFGSLSVPPQEELDSETNNQADGLRSQFTGSLSALPAQEALDNEANYQEMKMSTSSEIIAEITSAVVLSNGIYVTLERERDGYNYIYTIRTSDGIEKKLEDIGAFL